VRVIAAAAALLALSVAGAAWGDPRQWAPVAGKSRVGFEASFPLGDFSGRGEEVAGEFRADTADLKQGVTGTFSVRVRSLRTGLKGRDKDLWAALGADQHPEIRFTVESVEASFKSVTATSDVLLTIRGVLSIRGAERVVVWPGRVRLQDGKAWVRGETRLRMSDFGIPTQRRFFLAVKDEVLASFDLLLEPKP
jgi:polyisoprenoid-binding protein YceI